MATLLLIAAIPFVHPSIAAGAVALGMIPIIIHLINRRRYIRVPWAAMSFLLAANRRSARRVRLEQWILLLTRVAVITLFGLAIARPYLPASARLPFRSSGVHRVVIVDNSLSMRSRGASAERRFDRARASAEQLIESFADSDAVSLVTLASPVEVIVGQPAHDRRVVRERVASIRPTFREVDVEKGLAAVLSILKESKFPKANRAVYLVSDFPKVVWESATPGGVTRAARALRAVADELNESASDLTLVQVEPGLQDNVSVVALRATTSLIGPGVPVRIAAEIVNHGASTVRGATLQFRRDGNIIRQDILPNLQPGQSQNATVTMEFSTPGTHLIEARLSSVDHNALIEDDARYLSLEVRAKRPVLLVDGRPGSTRLSGHAGFLATALAPNTLAAEKSLLSPKIISDPELGGEILSSYDVVVLCNVYRLSPETWKRLEHFVSNGGGLMVFAGDQLNLENYNRLGYAEGSGLLPGAFERVAVDASGVVKSQTIALDQLVHPIVAEFSGHGESGLFAARIDRYLPFKTDPARGEVVLRYSNGDAALIVASLGKGRVLVCTTTANMDWTNLPAKGDFVSLMINAAAFLSPKRGEHRNLSVGDLAHERLSAVESSMPFRVHSSSKAAGAERGVLDRDASASPPSLVPDGDALAMEYGPIHRPGAVSISIGSDLRTFAANTDPDESKLFVCDEETLANAIGRKVRFVSDTRLSVDNTQAIRATELATAGLGGLMFLLLVEALLALWLGWGRAIPRNGSAGNAK